MKDCEMFGVLPADGRTLDLSRSQKAHNQEVKLSSGRISYDKNIHLGGLKSE